MIYSLCVFGLLLGALQNGDAYRHTAPQSFRRISASSRLQAIPDWTLSGAANAEEEQPSSTQLTVRFINTPTGKDVVVKDVEEGSNLLLVGDNAGIRLPRACRTGLCGSCTCEVKVPGSVASNAAEREGFVMIRACSVKCSLPPGMDEMVIDVHRMRKMSKGGEGAVGTAKTDFIDPMARFSGDWEKEFKPMWDNAAARAGNKAGNKAESSLKRQRDQMQGVYSQSGMAKGKKECNACAGAGRVVCYACLGKGSVLMGDGVLSGGMKSKKLQCPTCTGLQTTGCGYCRASGIVDKKK